MARKRDVYSGLLHMCVSALTGHTRFAVTLAVYCVGAVILLGYVSAQVCTSVLTEEIHELKQRRLSQREEFNKLTSQYVALTSRESVVHYCETELGMLPAGDGTTTRFAIGGEVFASPLEFTQHESSLPDLYRYSMNRESSESMR